MTAAAARGAAAISLIACFACQRADSTLLVEVTSDSGLGPASLQATVSADMRTWTEGLSGDFTLPVGLEISLPGEVVGPVTVAVQAFDADGGWLAGGVTEQEHINAGSETTVVVSLGEGGMQGPGP